MQIVDAMWEFPSYARFGSLSCPALLLPARWLPPSEAEADFLANKTAAAERLTSQFPQVSLHWLEDSVHDVPLQRPTELSRLILDFAAAL
jgi:pimeloyl-ACP methyl ester carboxylesterase